MTRQINLYNPALRPRREWLTGYSLLKAIGVMIVLLGLYGGVLHRQNQQLSEEASRVVVEIGRQQAELARLDEDLAQRKVSGETQAALQRAEAALLGRQRVREALESGALGSAEGFAEFLRAFARQTQEGLWMTGLQMAEGGRNITLQGRTLNPDQIPGYIRGLNGEPTLRGRSFEAMSVRLVGEEDGQGLKPGSRGETERGDKGGAAAKMPPYHEFLLSASVARQGNDDASAQGRGR